MAFSSVTVVAFSVVLCGALMGVCNTVYTEIALEVSALARPVASAGYNFVRWLAGVIAPFLAPLIAEHSGAEMTFLVAAVAALAAPAILVARRHTLGKYGWEPEPFVPEDIQTPA